ncbi:hypothetical protein SEA_DATBOI_157 [Gordonia phage DatBoi]|nr:hypothetical protein SEA_DATBOI_157 [Gordonia phage DatBoi]
MREYTVVMEVSQTIEAESESEAIEIATRCIEDGTDLWWPSALPDTAEVYEADS